MFRILVVEDDRDLNRTVCTFLNSSGYRTTGALSAAEAYDAMYETMFDLIVSDIMMPGIDGFEFAKTVRSLNENIPILFMTARDDFASKQRGYRIGADDYMVKPIDLDERCCGGQRSPLPENWKWAASPWIWMSALPCLGKRKSALPTGSSTFSINSSVTPRKPSPVSS